MRELLGRAVEVVSRPMALPDETEEHY